MTKTKADWTSLRLEYVNSSLSLRDLADNHNIKAAGVMARAAKEGWDEQRKQKQAEVSRAAQEQISLTRTDELAKFNEDDLRMARAIRGRAAQMMTTATGMTASELSAVARAADTAQKIGRLALGAETERTVNDNRSLPPLKDEDWL